MHSIELVGRDVFLRLGKGQPIQCFRAWDAPLLIASHIEQGIKAEEPYTVTAHSEAEYLAQRGRK